jgi:hypothetical protein
MSSGPRLALPFAALLLAAAPAAAQPDPASGIRLENPSAGRAFAMSLVLPGWGHRYANGGQWGGSGTFFALADAFLWTGLVGTSWQRSHVIQSYETLAATGAGADMDGKDRLFSLRLASFRSSDEFLEVSLRNRAWEDLSYVDDPAYWWSWTDEADYLRFRDLREDGESLGRRRTAIIATLVANRLISGFLAARSARSRGGADFALALRPTRSGSLPALDLALRF